jgi:hypothetical protein
MRKLLILAVVAVAVTAAVAGQTAAAAPGTPVAFVVDVDFAGGTQTIVPGTSTVPGCDQATVTDTQLNFAFPGQVGLFQGTKVFDCGPSGTFTLDYKAHVIRCAPTDDGTWQVADGTGLYAGMTGQGQVTGTYVGGPQCAATGILDSYSGTVRFAGGA